eukprot:9236205-Pyramimonas_sp.AAC.1
MQTRTRHPRGGCRMLINCPFRGLLGGPLERRSSQIQTRPRPPGGVRIVHLSTISRPDGGLAERRATRTQTSPSLGGCELQNGRN